ncbi:MAG: BrnA antitoxin family protein [Candidatus Poribacteria bacterium]|jgi:predicted DNA binding CopG/RHH family protein|nr:BrnA antitoxin family protein [Candidatus Poribacteria bacterium]
MKTLKKIPVFKTEEEERLFWQTHDSTDYLDWDKSEPVLFSHLKPTTKTISLRLPEYLLESLRTIANKRDVPYQSLLKLFLKERIEKENKMIKQSNPRST